MQLTAFVTSCVAGYALLQFFILPTAERRWSANRSFAKASKVGVLAALKSIRSLLQVAIVTYVVLVGLVLWITYVRGTSVTSDTLLAAIQRTSDWKKSIGKWTDGIGGLLFWLTIVGLTYQSYRANRQCLVERLHNAEEKRVPMSDATESSRPKDPQVTALECELAAERKRLSYLVGSHAASADDLAEASRIEKAIRYCNREVERLEASLRRLEKLGRLDASMPPEVNRGFAALWPPIMIFVTSKGAVKDLGLLKKLLSRGSTALLFVGLIGASAPIVKMDFDSRSVSLTDLLVKANHDDAVASWKAVGKEQPKVTLRISADDPEIRQLARVFSSAYIASLQPRADGTDRQAAYSERSSEVREHILRHGAEAVGAQLVRPGGGDQESDNDAADEILKARARTIDEPDAPTTLERTVARRMVEMLATKPGWVWEKLKAKGREHARLYGQPMASSDLRDTAVGEITGHFFDAAAPDFHDEALRQAESALQRGVEEAIQDSQVTLLDRFFTSLAGGQSVSDALQPVASQRDDYQVFTPAKQEAISATLASALDSRKSVIHGPIGIANRRPSNDSIGEAARIVQQLGINAAAKSVARLPYMALSSYEDWYVVSADDGLQGPAALVANRVQDKEGSRYSESGRDFLARRSHDFDMLLASPQTGGVVIGRKADASVLASITTLRWEPAEGGTILFTAVSDTGRSRTFGPYDHATIAQALLYAADGRLLAVTVVNTELNGVQRVILHPALQDTALGCDVIDIDRFIFDFIDPKVRQAINDRIGDDRIMDDLYLDTYDFLDGILRRDDVLTVSATASLRRLALRKNSNGKAFFSKQDAKIGLRRFYTSRQRVYDSTIADAVVECSAASDAEGYLGCIRKIADVDSFVSRLLFKLPKHPMEGSSAVSESRPAGNGWNSFMQTGTPPEPLTFSVHEPYWMGIDEEPVAIELNQFLSPIKVEVARLIAGDGHASEQPEARRIYKHVRDFTELQRFFRLALGGQLGNDFPVEQLARLESEVGASIPYVSTPRWLTYKESLNPKVLDLASSLDFAVASNDMPLGQCVKGVRKASSSDPAREIAKR